MKILQARPHPRDPSEQPWSGLARRSVRVLVSVVALLSLGVLNGCGSPSSLRFTQDRRVQITSPRPLATLSLPQTFEWRSSLPAGQRYALILGLQLVDPGQPISDLVPSDGQCRVTGDCRSVESLAAADVYLTTDTSLVVPNLPSIPVNQTSIEARLVLVDSAGRRQGESLWYVTLRVPKATS